MAGVERHHEGRVIVSGVPGCALYCAALRR